MKKRTSKDVVLYLAILILAVGTLLLGGINASMMMNYVFLIIMSILILWANKKGLTRVRRMSEDLGSIVDMIFAGSSYQEFAAQMMHADDTSAEAAAAHNASYLARMEKVGFDQTAANEDWHRFLNDWKNADGLDCEAEDYLCEDEMLERCNYNVCTQLPGILTALGILGTFLGLVLGLKSFDFSNADQMTSSVQALVGGLNVAFYTSIYGVTLSILFNFFFRRTLTDFNQSLNYFYDVVHLALKPVSQTALTERFYKDQEEQKALLQEIQKLLDQRFGERLAGQMAESLMPVFERINQSLDHIILDFHKEQAASLEKIVDAFVQQMSGALDGHIHGLGESVDQLSNTQNAMSEELRQLIRQIGRTGSDTAKINRKTGEILQNLNGYVAQLEQTTSDSAEIIRQMSHWSESIQNMCMVQSSILETLNEHEKNLDETCVKINENQAALTARLDDFTRAAAVLAEREQDPLQFNDLKDMLSAYMLSMQQLESSNAENLAAVWKQLDQENHLHQSERDQQLLAQMEQINKAQQDIVYLNGRIAGILSGQARGGGIELPSGKSSGDISEVEKWMQLQSEKMDAWMVEQANYQKLMFELEKKRNRSLFEKIRDFFSSKFVEL